jgi:hypothetical protein
MYRYLDTVTIALAALTIGATTGLAGHLAIALIG